MPLGFDSCAFQLIKEDLIGSIHFSGCAIFYRFLEDCVAVGVGQYHDVLISSTGFFGVTTGLIHEDVLIPFLLHANDFDENITSFGNSDIAVVGVGVFGC